MPDKLRMVGHNMILQWYWLIMSSIFVSFFKGHADEMTAMRDTGFPTDQKFLEW